jgi:MFS family permease
MPDLREFLRLNTPWLLAGFLLTFASSFGQTFFIAVFAGEIRAEFGLSHGQWGSIYAIATTASAAVMVYAGALTDRFRVRQIGLAALLALAAAAASMAVIGQVWLLVAVIFLLRLLGQGLMGHTAMVAMARWFVGNRGRAVSIAGLGVATGEAVLPLGFVMLMGVFDWRWLWLLAALFLTILAPVLLRLLKLERTPQSFGSDQASLGLGGRMWTRAEMLRHPVMWAMVPAILGPAAWNTAFFFHQVHLAEAKDWTHMSLVALFPLFTVSSITFMLIAGWLADRFGSRRLAPFYLSPLALGYLIFAWTTSPLGGVIGMICMGAAAGMSATMSATLWAELYGTRNLGSIRATLAAIMVLGTAIGPGITGALIDLGLSFPKQAYGISIYFALTSLLAAYAMRLASRH